MAPSGRSRIRGGSISKLRGHICRRWATELALQGVGFGLSHKFLHMILSCFLALRILRGQGDGLGLWATTIEIQINTGENECWPPHSARRVSTRAARSISSVAAASAPS